MKNELRVVSCNVRNSGAPDGPNAWPLRRDALLAHLASLDADVIGTQEVMADQFDALCAALPGHTPIGVAREDGARGGEFAAIFVRSSRFDVLAVDTFWLSETPDVVGSVGWDAVLARICTWARVRDRASSLELLVANTHFDHVGVVARTQSALLLRAGLPQLAAGAPIILTGDFNSTEDDEPYRALTAGFRLVDAYRIAHPERQPDEAIFNGFADVVAGARIDWILHTTDLVVAAAAIDRTRGSAGRFLSDHYLVDATLAFAG